MSLDFNHISTVKLLHTVAALSHKNIMISDQVGGDVSLHLHQVSWAQVLHTIAMTEQLGFRDSHGTTIVAPLDHWVEYAKKLKAYRQTQPVSQWFYRLNYADADHLAKILKSQKQLLTSSGEVAFDSRTNSIMIMDRQRALSRIKTLVRNIDVPVKQVMILARIVSLDRSQESQLGLQFSNIALSSGGKDDNGMALLHLNPHIDLKVALSALEAKGLANVISSPKIMTANRKTASIETGQEIPYQEKAGDNTTSVTFKKAVLRLKVTPEIIPGQKILLHLSIRQDKPSLEQIQGVPAIDTRQITTQVLVHNGRTVVLGGIYEHSDNQQRQRVPFLASIPILGHLFRYRAHRAAQQELLVFVTPREVRENNGKKQT